MTEKQLLAIRDYMKKELSKSKDVLHSFDHVDRVRKNALRIKKLLNGKAHIDERLLQAVCYVHDAIYIDNVSSIKTWLFEGIMVRRKLRNMLKKFNLSQREENIIINAAANHPKGFPLRFLNRKLDHYSQILQDADTVDAFNKDRLLYFRKKQKNKFFKIAIPILGSLLFIYGVHFIRKYLNYPEVVKKVKLDKKRGLYIEN